jgi:hypothetical protein
MSVMENSFYVDDVSNLFREGLITEREYHTYCVFMSDDFARGFLKNSIDTVLMETPPPAGEWAFSYHAGRMSVWRDIKAIIMDINLKLAEQRRTLDDGNN